MSESLTPVITTIADRLELNDSRLIWCAQLRTKSAAHVEIPVLLQCVSYLGMPVFTCSHR